MSFFSLYRHGFARVAACSNPVRLADPASNAAAVARLAQRCHDDGVALAVFPELALSGYAIDDLLLQDVLLDAVEAAVETLVEASSHWRTLVLVGAPLRHGNRLYNCAVAIQSGHLLGVVPKTYLPNYREFYEKRHFASGAGVAGQTIAVGARSVPFGTDLLFEAHDLPGFVVHAEICEDVWVPVPPSATAALAGATVLANLSASNITIGKSDTRRLLCKSHSLRCAAAYLYSAAGLGESTTDLAWDGQVSIYECGEVLAESDRFPTGDQIATADIDLDLIRQERARMGSFDDNARALGAAAGPGTQQSPAMPDVTLPAPLHAAASINGWRRVGFLLSLPADDLGLRRHIERLPFVPADPERLATDCYEAYNIQVAGLVQRLRATGLKKVVIGVSGGLDSTHALIVVARAMDLLGLPRASIHAYTLPGFATGDATKSNAWALMRSLGTTCAEIDIRPAALRMLEDIGHPYAEGEAHYDLTFENVQAGLRTDYLFRLAGHLGGIVIGTGDLSELALGWCTYGVGDQMAHYNVNAGVPKTLIQHLIRWVIHEGLFDADTSATLDAVVNTVISPELIPAGEGDAPQSTEAKIGPYELQDFNLYWLARFGFRPSKIAFMAHRAWGDAASGAWPPGFPADKRNAYSLEEIGKWLRLFIGRFFANQFKRTAMPNGPKVSHGGALSPRGDWRMPSDASATAWLAELDAALAEAAGSSD
ncbi:NAD(+) synthase [Derxia gummosa]|uniref:Glutamine-dependent NAD(+) synthetase n=1 Tax=Derxia gummosa DSM 723 TaxID=1121388 RepID=A0A8B6X531_9BURK|nr:NAD(+) synthase [Derxia gummosa]